MATWTRDRILALASKERQVLYENARGLDGDDASAVVALIEAMDDPFAGGTSVNLDDPLVRRIHEIVNSPEGKAACIRAVDAGHPALGGVDPLIAEKLGSQYGAHNMSTNAAGWIVADLMRALGYRKQGKSASTPEGSVARSGELWK